MYNGIKYILAKPVFNKENLLKLYNILLFSSLDDENKLNSRNEKIFKLKDDIIKYGLIY